MIQKHITGPIKRWAKEKLKNTYLEFESVNQVSKHNGPILYFPHLKDSDSFVISKKKEKHELCELGLPIPPEHLWLGYGKDIKVYLFGKSQVSKMLDIVSKSDFF